MPTTARPTFSNSGVVHSRRATRPDVPRTASVRRRSCTCRPTEPTVRTYARRMSSRRNRPMGLGAGRPAPRRHRRLKFVRRARTGPPRPPFRDRLSKTAAPSPALWNHPKRQASIAFGRGVIDTPPGSAAGLQLVVADADAAHAELAGRGAAVGDVQEFPWGRFVFPQRSRRQPLVAAGAAQARLEISKTPPVDPPAARVRSFFTHALSLALGASRARAEGQSQ